jgi:ankyrin repeat protein
MEEPEHLCVEAEELEPLAEPVLEAVRTGGVAEARAAVERHPGTILHRSHIYVYDALELAIAMGKLDVARALLELGADPNAWSHELSTPLSVALTAPAAVRAAAIDLLVEHHVRARPSDLDVAAMSGRLDVLDRVLALPRNEDGEDDEEVPTLTELHARTLEGAARAGNVAAMEAVLLRVPDLGEAPANVIGAFEAAMTECRPEAWRWLERFEISSYDRVVRASHWALRGPKREGALALAREAVGTRPALGPALLLGASGTDELVELALAHGADPNVRGNGGQTPMMVAAAHGHVEGIAMLSRAGADPSLVDDRGRGAWSYAHGEVVAPTPELLAALRAAGVPETEVAPREEPRRPLGAAEHETMNLWAVGCGLAIGVAVVVVVLVLHGVGLM